MNPDSQELLLSISRIRDWIEEYLKAQQERRVPIDSMGFPRLPQFFSPGLLSGSYVVSVDRVDLPPLSGFGLQGFSFFESQEYSGITYKDTYFLVHSRINDESLHFHELIHVIQWDELGPDMFLLLYGLGLFEQGYRKSPLERNAFSLQKSFREGRDLARAETTVRQHCRYLVREMSRKHPWILEVSGTSSTGEDPLS